MQGEPFLDVLAPHEDEHWPFVVSSWPLYFAEGEITATVCSGPRRIANYMPLTITIWDRSLILGRPDDRPEFHDLVRDLHEQTNAWDARAKEAKALSEKAISFLEEQGAPQELLAPRRESFEAFVPTR